MRGNAQLARLIVEPPLEREGAVKEIVYAAAPRTDEFYLSDAGEFMIEYWKRPWENVDGYASHSPLTFAAHVTTPLLIQHGENDRRVPIAGAWKFYRALKALGKTVDLDIYPRGGHVLFEPVQEREQMRRNLEWFQRWLRSAAAQPPL